MMRMTPHPSPCYASGTKYRGMHSADAEHHCAYDLSRDRAIALTSPDLGWARFWEIIAIQLDRRSYSESTQALYRSVLRGFYRTYSCAPALVTANHIRAHLDRLAADHYSWSWIAMNISILRTVFDKLGGEMLTHSLVTPKRPEHLPEILSHAEVRRILNAAPSTRDQLLLGLMYGCGLKVGELCRLTWSNIDLTHSALRLPDTAGDGIRMLDIPPELLPVLALGQARCPAADYLFQGRVAGKHLSKRMVALIVRKAAQAAGSLKPVTGMTLRHSFAVHCVERGDNIRALQEALGHNSIETTMLYTRCILPRDAVSPLDELRQRPDKITPEPPEPDPEQPEPPLFAHPLSVDAQELPFRDDSTVNIAAAFYRALKTHILGRFLCRRGATRAG